MEREKEERTREEIAKWFAGLQAYLMAAPEWPTFKALYEGKDAFDLEAIGAFHSKLWNASFGNDQVRDLFLKLINEYHRQQLQLPQVLRDQTPEMQARLQSLTEKGHCPLPKISSSQLSDLKNYFASQTPRDLNGNISEFPTEVCVRAPHFLSIANDPHTLAIVENYLGTTPTIKIMEAWWSHAGKPAAKDAQLFHLDYDDYKFCKLFIYLTDVDMQSGPHVYIEALHTTHRVKSVIAEQPELESEASQWYLSTLRKSDDDVSRFFRRQPQYLTGEAGTTFLVDTRGIHKGMLPQSRDRLICQVTYGVTPQVAKPIERIPSKDLPSENIQNKIGQMPYSFINRLFIDCGEENSPNYY